MILQRISDWWFNLRAKHYQFENSGKTVLTIKNIGRRPVELKLEAPYSYPSFARIAVRKNAITMLGPFPTAYFGSFGVSVHYTGKAEFRVQDFSKEAALGKLI